MADKRPSFQFYPGDWLKDPALRSVSSGARGLWIDMLCLMHESDPRGYLQTATGKPLDTNKIARMTGNLSLEEVKGWLAELEDSGVFSRSASGVIYSRRLLRDERKRKLCAEAGRKGGGNPNLAKQANLDSTFKGSSKGDAKGDCKGDSKGDSKQNPNPSSSSSSSTSVSPQTPLEGSNGEIDQSPEGLAQQWVFHCARKDKSGLGSQDTIAQMVPRFEELIRLGHDPDKLYSLIVNKNRNKLEYFWEFEKRLPKVCNGFKNMTTQEWKERPWRP